MSTLTNQFCQTSKGRGIPFTILAVLAWLLSSCLGAAEAESVRIAGSAWVGDAPTRIADQLGLFNVDTSAADPVIEVDQYASGVEALQAMRDNHAEFALAAATPVAAALLDADFQEHGQPDLVVLASVALSNRSHKLIVRQPFGDRDPAQWQDLRVGVMMGSSSHFGWSRFSTFHGMDKDQVTLVDLRVEDMAGALIAGEVDAVLVWRPWDQALQDRIGDDLVEHSLRMFHTVNWLLVADRDHALQHPEVVGRVLQAYRKAMTLIDGDPEHAYGIYSDASGLPMELVRRSADGMIWRLSLNWSALVAVTTQLEWLATWGEFADRTPPPPRQYFHGQPLRELAEEIVNLADFMMMSEPTSSEGP